MIFKNQNSTANHWSTEGVRNGEEICEAFPVFHKNSNGFNEESPLPPYIPLLKIIQKWLMVLTQENCEI